jgi:hypothetical protein
MSYVSGNCSVCFDDLTPSNYLIVCWNSHSLCADCYKRQKQPRRSREGVRYPTTCPECREGMFDWDIPQVARRVVVRRCGRCREPGHDRRTCPLTIAERRRESAEAAVVGAERRLAVLRDDWPWAVALEDRAITQLAELRRRWEELTGEVWT